MRPFSSSIFHNLSRRKPRTLLQQNDTSTSQRLLKGVSVPHGLD
jgi:hypothetical protein